MHNCLNKNNQESADDSINTRLTKAFANQGVLFPDQIQTAKPEGHMDK